MRLKIWLSFTGIVSIGALVIATAPGISASPALTQTPACRATGCEVGLVKLATLKDREPRALGDYSVFVVQDRAGRFYAASSRRDSILVFAADGAFQTALKNPSFQRISVFQGRRGSVLVHDYQRQRLQTLGDDLAVRDAGALAYAPAFVLDDGRFVISQHIRTPERVGYPLHVVDAAGAIVRSFGVDTPQFQGGLHRVDNRVVGLSADGSVWAAAPGRYVLERWNPVSGARLARVPVRASWFVESANVPDERQPPTPLIEALWEQDGVVWTLVRVADAAWKAPQRPNTERAFDVAEYDRIYDWVIEVVDPRTGEVLAHRRLPTAHWTRPPVSLLVSRAPAGATVAFEVWKPKLEIKGGTE